MYYVKVLIIQIKISILIKSLIIIGLGNTVFSNQISNLTTNYFGDIFYRKCLITQCTLQHLSYRN